MSGWHRGLQNALGGRGGEPGILPHYSLFFLALKCFEELFLKEVLLLPPGAALPSRRANFNFSWERQHYNYNFPIVGVCSAPGVLYEERYHLHFLDEKTEVQEGYVPRLNFTHY